MTTLITGTSSGLGLELAKVFLSQGHAVIGLSRSAAAFSHPGYRHFAADIADKARVGEIARALGLDSLDLIVNNAGLPGSGRLIAEVDNDEVQQLLNVNLFGALNVVQSFLGPLKGGSGKRIVNISSRFGSLSFNQRDENRKLKISYSYRISKAAQNMLAVCLGNELEEFGITVDVVHPGSFQSHCGRADATAQPAEIARGIAEWLASGERTSLTRLHEIGGRGFEW